MRPEQIREAIGPLVQPDSLKVGVDKERRGFDVEAELPADKLVEAATLFRDAGYILECLSAVDQEDYREVWYQFNRLSNEPDRYLFRVRCDEADSVPTLQDVIAGANWLEREAWDMVGVRFAGAPEEPRILLPETSDFHPLRRDQCIDDELREQREKYKAKRLAREKAAAAKAAKAAEAAEAAKVAAEDKEGAE